MTRTDLVAGAMIACTTFWIASAHSPSPTLTSRPEDLTMISFVSVTPNLFVTDMDRAMTFYRDVLGFEATQTVPGQAPFVFAMMSRGDVTIFLNDLATVQKDVPDAAAARPATAAAFIVVQGVDALFERVQPHARVIQPLKDQFYGMREFSVLDPDGYVLTFAERKSD